MMASMQQWEMTDTEITLKVNGCQRTLVLEPRVTLLDALREMLGLTGAKKGCDRGECGTCTVLLDGRRVYACMTLAVMHNRSQVTTIEALASGADLHPLQQAFVSRDALQCGFCTPGQILSAIGLLAEGRATSDAEVRESMSGNLCRCGAYPNIVAAIRDVAEAG
jgi:xanthine dehydrogenase YagT iron-sulfur-binding subunit